MSRKGSTKKSKEETKHAIDIEWFGDPSQTLSQQNTPANQLQVEVYSRKIKNLEHSPPDRLFRTHQYEFRVTPNDRFFDWAGTKHGFVMDLKIFKKKELTDRRNKASSFEDEWVEYSDNDKPLIACTYTEDTIEGVWRLYLSWPDNAGAGWKGTFCFELSIFRRIDKETFRRIAYKRSAGFAVYSKPEVYLKQRAKSHPNLEKKGKKRASRKQEDNEDYIDNLPPKTKKIRQSTRKQSENRFFDEEPGEAGSPGTDFLSQVPSFRSTPPQEEQADIMKEFFSTGINNSINASSSNKFSLTPPSDIPNPQPRTPSSSQVLSQGSSRGFLTLHFSQGERLSQTINDVHMQYDNALLSGSVDEENSASTSVDSQDGMEHGKFEYELIRQAIRPPDKTDNNKLFNADLYCSSQ